MKKRIRKKTDSKQIAEKADTAMWEYQQERGGEHLLYVTEYIRHRSYLFE